MTLVDFQDSETTTKKENSTMKHHALTKMHFWGRMKEGNLLEWEGFIEENPNKKNQTQESTLILLNTS
jgi:hypothetical protein